MRALTLAVMLYVMGSAATWATTSGNLLVGGGGEAGTCTTDWSATTTVPGWTVTEGDPAVVCYAIGSFSTPDSSAGHAFIADGPYGDSALRQVVDVSSAGSRIDGGQVNYDLSGWLGGYGAYNGRAVVTATFLDAQGRPLGAPAQIAGPDAAARGDSSGFQQRSASGRLPVGTRSISVLLQFVDTSASYNIGYADKLSLTVSTPVTAPVLQRPVSKVPAFDHVFVVMMENTDYGQVIGDRTDAPFINDTLASQGTLFDDARGVYHPSDENYLAVAGGDTFVQGAIYYPNIHVSAANIADGIEAAGKTWKAYEQGMGTPCNTSKTYDSYYAADDAPFINFTDIASDATRCAAHLFDTKQLSTDLKSAATTPNFAWIAADDYYDGEASGNGSANSLKVQDGWLKQTLQPIFDSPAWKDQRSLLILTWDESESRQGNRIATLLLGSQGLVRAGAISTASYDHYSTARTIEDALGLSPLTANDRYATPANDAFAGTATSPASPFMRTEMPSVPRGTYVAFDYGTPVAQLSGKNWVGIYPAGKKPGQQSSLSWQYVRRAGGTVSFDTSGLAPGSYVAWYCHDDGYTTLAGPVAFTVTP